MNLGLSDLQKSKFSKYNLVARTINSYTEIPDFNWIAGFASDEGCFFVNIFKYNKICLRQGHTVQLIFKFTQHKRDKELLDLRAKFFNLIVELFTLTVKMLSFSMLLNLQT